jgi:hypothetical protein
MRTVRMPPTILTIPTQVAIASGQPIIHLLKTVRKNNARSVLAPGTTLILAILLFLNANRNRLKPLFSASDETDEDKR